MSEEHPYKATDNISAAPDHEIVGPPSLGGPVAQLRIMMFLQYFIWGSWWLLLGGFIHANTEGESAIFAPGFIGLAYSTSPIAAMIAPFFVGMIADRFAPTQYMLALLHLLAAGFMIWLYTVNDQWMFFTVLILYYLCYMPTLALTNSLSFHHLASPDAQFPGVRVLGTIGWIVAGWIYFTLNVTVGWDVKEMEIGRLPMIVAAIAGVVMAGYCLLLPHTPPPRKGEKVKVGDILGLDALVLLKNRSFTVFVIGSFLICIPLTFYYNYSKAFLDAAGMENVSAKLTFGQMSEILFMLLMPFFFVRLGVKRMLLVGMLAWVARYLCFAFGDSGTGVWMLYTGIVVHGICYDFFFVTGQIYVDRKAGVGIRAAAQGFITFVTLGVGMFVGALLSSWVEVSLSTKEMVMKEGKEIEITVIDWTPFWLIPAAIAGVVMVVFAIAFKDDAPAEEPAA